jgi:hypothetical protein
LWQQQWTVVTVDDCGDSGGSTDRGGHSSKITVSADMCWYLIPQRRSNKLWITVFKSFRIGPGISTLSFGIDCAESARIPGDVLLRAQCVAKSIARNEVILTFLWSFARI